ncbi:macro domain-containing protein [Pararhizobium sp. BT-229]|uniref:macro domain-containing protein n=1 Tax=Pararhizobium sp. BT-229 TaxID=2986923 RepID=UPI0021F70F76|nr:macro domain-containing protein [Pararhizobium sp. BT-229]MCV9963936.1 macro domain-containing protein [Pararhizobium sp. BT-229]
MIEYREGDLLADDADALVNTVNCVGAMGKGIALAFKSEYPENYRLYKSACDRGEVRPGGLFVTEPGSMFGPRFIVNVATKDDWRDGSKMEWVENGARAISAFCMSARIGTIAVPALGCSNGGLPWARVRQVLERQFSDGGTVFRVYPPS